MCESNSKEKTIVEKLELFLGSDFTGNNSVWLLFTKCTIVLLVKIPCGITGLDCHQWQEEKYFSLNPPDCFQYSLIAAYLAPRDVEQWIKLSEMAIELGKLKEAATFYTRGRSVLIGISLFPLLYKNVDEHIENGILKKKIWRNYLHSSPPHLEVSWIVQLTKVLIK